MCFFPFLSNVSLILDEGKKKEKTKVGKKTFFSECIFSDNCKILRCGKQIENIKRFFNDFFLPKLGQNFVQEASETN